MSPEVSREILTERLALRPLEVGSVTALHALWTDEPVRRFLWDGKVVSLETTREIVEKSGALFEKHGYGLWGVRDRDGDELLGFAGYWYFRTPPALELLFGVAAGQWNRGIATEASHHVIGYGFGILGFHTIAASTDVGNTASVRVLEKLGMRFDRREVIEGLDTVFFRQRRADWQADFQAPRENRE